MGNAEVKMQAPSVESNVPYTEYVPEDGMMSSTEGTAEAFIRFAPAGPASKEACPPMTVPEMFKRAASKRGDKPALRTEGDVPLVGKTAPPALPMEQWKSWSWQEYYDESCQIAKALMATGMEQHGAANIFGFNSPEWFMAEMGAIVAGGKAAGIYPTDTADQIAFKAAHSGANVAFLEDEGKLAKFTIAAKTLPELKAIVCWGCEPKGSVEGPEGREIPVYTWEEFKKLGDAVTDEQLAERIGAQKPGHCCALIYTSGTTGQPKAVMITHDNILMEAHVAGNEMALIAMQEEQERVLSYLPLSHVAGMLVDIVMPMVLTATRPGWVTAFFARQYDLKAGSVGDRLRAVRPTLFLGVPRVWEKIAEKLKAIGAQTTGLKKTISTWAKAKSLEHQMNCQLGGDGSSPFGHGIANVLLKKIKTALGLDACKFGFTGAAPITKATLEYFGSLGIQINEVYGMSENTGATTWSTNECHVWGSCGYEIPGTEVKVFRVSETDLNDKTECPRADDLGKLSEEEKGEVCFRGRHVMLGYMANPALGEEHVATIKKKLAEAIDRDGWLHSGDQGAIDKRGMVKITGRYKELIIGAGGENIAPVPFEDRVKELCPAVSNFLMIGDQQKFNVALVTLKAVGATGENPGTDVLDGAAAKVDPSVTKISEAVKSEAFIKLVTEAITATNADGTACPMNAAKVQKFTILPRDFSVDTGELTPTLKTKRSVVSATFAKSIEAMYASKDVYTESPDTVESTTAAAE